MIILTLALLRAIAPRAPDVTPYLNEAMKEHEINTPMRQAAFLGQCAHESNQFRVLAEEATGEAYEGRADLGNTQPGDGRRFKGRGCIQITGRDNYARVSKAIGVDFLTHPEWLEMPRYGYRASAWWWKHHGCNELADGGYFTSITKVVNGRRMLGLRQRWDYFLAALDAFGVPAASLSESLSLPKPNPVDGLGYCAACGHACCEPKKGEPT